MKTPLRSLLVITLWLAAAGVASAQGTAFTYQGRLNSGTNFATGLFDLTFTLFSVSSGAGQVGSPITNSATGVTNGLFAVTLEFGAGMFPGANRWLEIGVRTNGPGAFTTLSPRQPLTATPYAITAGDVTGANISRLNVPNTATQATGVPTVSFGFIVNGTVTGGGFGYLTPPTVTVNDATGSGAIITASISGGVATGLAVQANGSGYSTNATLTIAPPPNNAFQTFVTPNFFTGINTMNNVNNTFTGSFTGNGAGLTVLSASQLASGTVADARLSANVPLLNGSPTFAGTVTAASFSGNGAVPWQVVSGTSQQAQPNTGYLLTNNALVTLTLPTAPNPGDAVRVSGSGAGGWKVAQNANQSVLVKNLPGNFGAFWTPREINRNWQSVASSSDGRKLVAVVNGGQIYTSTDAGVTWVPRDGNRNWFSVASSSDGSKLVAVDTAPGQIYTSTNLGVTWTPRDSNRGWAGVASSSDGIKLVAVVSGGQIYTSTNSGVNWTARDSSRSWWSIASSSDGGKLIAGLFPGGVYTSTDSGVTWTVGSLGGGSWKAVASSADGSKLVAANQNGLIYTSTDSGVTWTPRESARGWLGVASSADGSKLVAAVYGGQIYSSTDSGAIWTARDTTRNWLDVAASADGSKLVAAVQGGQIYTSTSDSTVGTGGYLLGEQTSAIELQYIGNGQFVPLTHEGTIIAY